jgi:thiol-disulfide isomerase/thioredoxin
MKHFLKLFPLLLVITLNVNAQNKQIKFEHGSWTQILEKSKKENKMIYLDCFTTWCGPCKWMAKNIFTNDTVADFYNAQFVNVEMDMEKGEGLELAKKYGIQAYPTMLYLNSNGEVMHRTCGSAPVQAFVDMGKTALDPNKQLASLTKKFNNGNTDGAFAKKYISMLESGCEDYSNALSAYFAAQKENELVSRNNWNMIHQYVNDYSSREFIYLEKNKELFEKSYTKDSVQTKINQVYSSGLILAIRKKDSTAYRSLRAKVKESGSTDADRIVMDADMRYFKARNDWKNYASASSVYADKYIKDDAMALNGLAWNFYENVDDKAMLEKAADWAKHSTELQIMYANMDTYAALLYKLGKKEEAKKAAEKAIELAKTEGNNYSETEDLLKKIEQLKPEARH